MGTRSFRASAAGVEKLSQAFNVYGKTQDDLARVVGCTRQTVNKFLTGKAISKELFKSLCNELRLNWEDIAELRFDREENSWTVPSMNRLPSDISITQETGAVTLVAEPNNVQTCITYDTINGQVVITIPGDINSFLNNEEKRNDLLKALKAFSGDQNATIAKIEQGSIKITFNLSPDGIRRLEEEPDKILLVARIISRAKGEKLDLTDTDLSGVDLSGVDLSGINFSCADLSNANLENANLENADLDCADLSGANLRAANLRGTSLNDSIIDNKWLTVWEIVNQSSVDRNLRGADLIGANLSDADSRGANLSYANLSYANLRSANLRSADLRGANLSYTNLIRTNLSYTNLRGADLSYADLSYANLRSANLRSANLSDTDLSYADLRSANLSDADLRGANLSYANLSYANLSYANLIRTNLSDVALVFAKVKNAHFENNPGIYEDAKRDLKQRGAILLTY